MKTITVKFLINHVWQIAQIPDYISDYDDMVNWAAWMTKRNSYLNFLVSEC